MKEDIGNSEGYEKKNKNCLRRHTETELIIGRHEGRKEEQEGIVR